MLHGGRWATTPQHHTFLSSILNDRLINGKLAEAEIKARLKGMAYGIQAHDGSEVSAKRGKAIVPVHGTLLPKTRYENVSAVTNTQKLADTFGKLADDDDVDEVLIDFDTNGGSVQSLSDAAEALRYLSSMKKTIGYSSGAANSAGYWLLAQTSRRIANPNATIGSIGVIMSSADTSKRYEREGIKPIYITSGDKKASGADGLEFSAADESYYQEIVDESAKEFYSEVARGLNISVEDVRERYGSARVWTARKAMEVGLVDEVGTFASLGIGTDYLSDSNPQYAFSDLDLNANKLAETNLGADASNDVIITEGNIDTVDLKADTENESESEDAINEVIISEVAEQVANETVEVIEETVENTTEQTTDTDAVEDTANIQGEIMDLNKFRAENNDLYQSIVLSAQEEIKTKLNADFEEVRNGMKASNDALQTQVDTLTEENDALNAKVASMEESNRIASRKNSAAKVFGSFSFPDGFLATQDEKVSYYANLEQFALSLPDGDTEEALIGYIKGQTDIYLRGQANAAKEKEVAEEKPLITDESIGSVYDAFKQNPYDTQASGSQGVQYSDKFSYDNFGQDSGLRKY